MDKLGDGKFARARAPRYVGSEGAWRYPCSPRGNIGFYTFGSSGTSLTNHTSKGCVASWTICCTKTDCFATLLIRVSREDLDRQLGHRLHEDLVLIHHKNSEIVEIRQPENDEDMVVVNVSVAIGIFQEMNRIMIPQGKKGLDHINREILKIELHIGY
ncbi:hypothetical protein BC936DRAFT_141590 [Jimgerdemannia flammicorona]|uniref:Uncharacterized protein n=1 Tax=Jimgerdemannia flammicorona TaxID=994334 RepID=A0A433A1Z6_9FUNG|nr:hypothetical protein BC936DRAFT_141590 [Jimgerdemannia flammicorona]